MQIDFRTAVKNLFLEQKSALGTFSLNRPIQFRKDTDMLNALVRICTELRANIAKSLGAGEIDFENDQTLTSFISKVAAYSTKQRWFTHADILQGFDDISSNLVDALSETPQALSKPKAGIAGILKAHYARTSQEAAQIRRELINSPDQVSAPLKVYDLEDEYELVELVTKLDLKHETAMLDHCVGKATGGDYHRKIRNKESRIFSLRDKNGQAYATIEYKIKQKRIAQIEGKPRKIEKDAPFLAALGQAVKKLSTESNIDLCNGVRGLPLAPYEFLTTELDIKAFDLDNLPAHDIIFSANVKIALSEDMEVDLLHRLCSYPHIEIDITECSNNWLNKNLPSHIRATLISLTDDHLELVNIQVAGHIKAYKAPSIALPMLVKAGDIEADVASRLYLPKLKVAGYFAAMKAQKINLPCLKEVEDLLVMGATELSCPRLQTADLIDARKAVSFFTPLLNSAMGINAEAACELKFPQLLSTNAILGQSATIVDCPRLEDVEFIQTPLTHILHCPELKSANMINVGISTDTYLHPQCECQQFTFAADPNYAQRACPR